MAQKVRFYAGFEYSKKQPDFDKNFARWATIGQPLSPKAMRAVVRHERKRATISTLFQISVRLLLTNLYKIESATKWKSTQH